MKNYILAIDEGTTGATALLFNIAKKEIVNKCNFEFKQYFPKQGYVEHDLNEVKEAVRKAVSKVILDSKILTSQIHSIGITNQRETSCIFDHHNMPLHKAIVWQDRRTQGFCAEKKPSYEKLKKKTGLPLDAYFSATKFKWLQDNLQPSQDYLFGTIDTYLTHWLTAGESYVTDASNASRTLLFDINKGDWDQELLDFFQINKNNLPKVCDSFGEFGRTKGLDFLPDGIPILCILGDQQSALFGQGCINKGDTKCTYGTGAFILSNTGDTPYYPSNGILSTVAYQYKGQLTYALEGSTYIAGAAVQWLRDSLKIIKSARDTQAIASKSLNEQTQNLFFFPFFTGISAPYWRSEVTASITGMTRGTDDTDIVKVTLEGIAQSVADSIGAISTNLDTALKNIQVDGGACANDLLMQMQSNFSQATITRPQIIETTALGVIHGCLVASNKWSMNEVKTKKEINRVFKPVNDLYFENKREKWQQLVTQL